MWSGLHLMVHFIIIKNYPSLTATSDKVLLLPFFQTLGRLRRWVVETPINSSSKAPHTLNSAYNTNFLG